ncbi:toprim domain-containing protein, partial [Listeria monocytogenes]|uniref:toprim domain-containing protein n=1 Tax=Listeria monocytogenes TaxID=1639 RepID=UPI002FDC145B
QFLKTLTNKVILGLDNDKAGREGTERTKSLLKKEGFYIQEIQYPNGMKDLGDLIRYEMNDSAKYDLYKSIISQQIKHIL